jgi:tRNA pseudouridine55 synthase
MFSSRLAALKISAFEIIDIRFAAADGPIDVDVEVDCSSGTYVRALARDIGTDLGVFGHLTALRRTRVGDFELEQAVTLPEDLDVPAPKLITLAEAARTLLPTVTVGAEQATALMQGKTVASRDWTAEGGGTGAANAPAQSGGEVAVICDDVLVSVAEVRADGGLKSLTAFAIDLA